MSETRKENPAGIAMSLLVDTIVRETRGRTYSDPEGRDFVRDVLVLGWRLLGPIDLAAPASPAPTVWVLRDNDGYMWTLAAEPRWSTLLCEWLPREGCGVGAMPLSPDALNLAPGECAAFQLVRKEEGR